MNEEHVTKTMEQLKSMRYRSYSSDKPWLDAEGELIWSQSRVQAAKLVFSQSFETCMGLIIVGNLMLIVYEANESAKCFPDYANNVYWMSIPERSQPLALRHKYSALSYFFHGMHAPSLCRTWCIRLE